MNWRKPVITGNAGRFRIASKGVYDVIEGQGRDCHRWQGGNSGIGRAIVLELARQHANLVIDYVCHPEATRGSRAGGQQIGDQSVGVEADVSKLADLEMLVDKTVSKFGRVDIMVNNAGIETRTSILDTTEDQYERVMAINLKSAFFGTQIAAKQMIKLGGRRIINISSVHEDWPIPGTPHIARRKAACGC